MLAVACQAPDVPERCAAAKLSEDEERVRTSLKYVEQSPDKTKWCVDCTQYRPGPSGACGGCSLMAGPIHPRGTCAAFAPKA